MSIAEFYMENGLGEDYDIDDWLRDQAHQRSRALDLEPRWLRRTTTTFGTSTEHEARSGILTRTASQYSIIFVTQNGRMVIGMHITHSLPPGTYKANSSTPACGASSQHAMREAVSDAAAMSPSLSSSSFSSTLLFDLPP